MALNSSAGVLHLRKICLEVAFVYTVEAFLNKKLSYQVTASILVFYDWSKVRTISTEYILITHDVH